ncbi:MAG: hypothetical protein IJE08_06440 [Clostridia bacterium]|nr:hypothetical protein [Clostridia bacterium]
MTDIHQHILWGLDDGPEQPQGMQAMLRKAAKQRVTRIAATPHVCPGFEPFDPGVYYERLGEAQAYCDSNGLGIQLMPGAEVAWTYQTAEALRRGKVPTLGDTDCVLIELWRDVSWSDVRAAVSGVLRTGFVPVLAHIERYRCFVWQPGRALALKHELPVGYQVNASTIIEPCGFMVKRFVRQMLDERGIDAVASDAHDAKERPVRMDEAYRALKESCSAGYAEELVNFNGVVR